MPCRSVHGHRPCAAAASAVGAARIEAGQNPDSIPLEDLRALVQRFEEHNLTSRTDLIGVLSLKAGEYRADKARIDGLDDRVAAVANLKDAARDAAETRIAGARNALMRGRAGRPSTS